MDAPLFAEGIVTNSEFREHRVFVEPGMDGRGFSVTELWISGAESLPHEEGEWVPGAKSLHAHLWHAGHEIVWKVFSDELLKPLLVSLEQSLHTHEVRRNAQVLERLLSPEYLEIGASGRTYNREQIIQLLATSQGDSIIRADSFELKRLGAGVAMLLYRSWESGSEGEKLVEAKRTSIWSCSLGQWAMVFHQGTLSPRVESAT